MMRITVREADCYDPIDADAILTVLDSYAADPIGGGEPLTADVRQHLIAAIRDHPTSLVLLAFVDGDSVGLAICFYGLSTFQARPLLNIHDLAVLPKYRGHGVGRALLQAAESRASAGGCCRLTLEVQEGNTVARNLYEQFGFADVVLGDSGPTRFLSKSLDDFEP